MQKITPFLTVKEEIVVEKAIAAKIISKTPVNEEEKHKSLLTLGLLAAETFAYIDKHGALRIGKIVSENQEGLKKVKNAIMKTIRAKPLPQLSIIESPSTALEDWLVYAQQGPETHQLDELNKAITTRQDGLTKEQIEIFFNHVHNPRPDNPATAKQKNYIASLVVSGAATPPTQDEWVRMTKKEASSALCRMEFII